MSGSAGRGQSLVELALCLPVLVSLALGCTQLVRLAEARAGLDAATAAAVASAARSPDMPTAAEKAQARFAAVSATYPLREPALYIDLRGFDRGGSVTGSATGEVELGLVPIPGIPATVSLHSSATARVQEWRSR